VKPSTYKGAIYKGAGAVDVVELAYPRCGDDDVIVRNLLTGVCGSDVAAYRHGAGELLIVEDHEFGHEAISEIVEIGRNVQDLALGDHVFVDHVKLMFASKEAAKAGGFSEYVHVPQGQAGENLLRIDNDIPVRTAVLFEPFVIGTRAARNLDPRPGQTAIVFGAGIIGLATAVMLQWLGCGKVMVVDISDYRLGKARGLGFAVCNPQSEDLKAKAHVEFGIKRDFHGERCAADLYADAIGMKPAIDNFMDLAVAGATLAVVGVHHEPATIDLTKLCFANLRIIGCGSASFAEAGRDVLAMMRSGRFDLSTLVTHEYKVDQIEDALVMGSHAHEAQKVCISF
jgi:threonine dehydrogenase-like Zn-dependent dehydrogenase